MSAAWDVLLPARNLIARISALHDGGSICKHLLLSVAHLVLMVVGIAVEGNRVDHWVDIVTDARL